MFNGILTFVDNSIPRRLNWFYLLCWLSRAKISTKLEIDLYSRAKDPNFYYRVVN